MISYYTFHTFLSQGSYFYTFLHKDHESPFSVSSIHLSNYIDVRSVTGLTTGFCLPACSPQSACSLCPRASVGLQPAELVTQPLWLGPCLCDLFTGMAAATEETPPSARWCQTRDPEHPAKRRLTSGVPQELQIYWAGLFLNHYKVINQFEYTWSYYHGFPDT